MERKIQARIEQNDICKKKHGSSGSGVKEPEEVIIATPI